MKECIICKKEFDENHTRRKCCSIECLNIYNNQKAKQKRIKNYNIEEHKRICPYCNISFICKHLSVKYCSNICKSKYRIRKDKEKHLLDKRGITQKLIYKECAICKTPFQIHNSSTLKCCSKECSKIFKKKSD